MHALDQSRTCWVCGSNKVAIVKESNIAKALTSDSFAITDSSYGQTTTLAKCGDCGFIQSADDINTLDYYEALEDHAYEANRTERALQARKILLEVQAHQKTGRLLDIGAGSGILVEEALRLGYAVEGVEPSAWLHTKAVEHKLPVTLGTFPHEKLTGPYDVITIVDVIEHVDNPLALLTAAYSALAPGGLIAVITPDVGSLVARVLGYRWWHFRVAHIGYFNEHTLGLALRKTGFQKVSTTKATWYFAADYLWDRVCVYLPVFMRLSAPKFLRHITVPLNLGDSLFAIYKKPLN